MLGAALLAGAPWPPAPHPSFRREGARATGDGAGGGAERLGWGQTGEGVWRVKVEVSV